MRKGILIAAAFAALVLVGPQAHAQDAVAQMQLSDAQIQQYLDASPEIEAVMGSTTETSTNEPDPKTVAKLEQIAKKHKYASFGEFETVADNVMLVLQGVDAETKKYVGPEVVIKKEIADLKADKQVSAEDKKQGLAELDQELKAAAPVKFKSNIDLVLKYYDKLAPTEEQGKKP